MASKDKKYIDGDRMGVLALEAAESGMVSDELIEMFYTLARRSFDHYLHYRQRTYADIEREDAVQEAVIACHQATLKFEKGRGGAYSFFRTTVANFYASLWLYHSRQKRAPTLPMVSLDNLIERENRMEEASLNADKRPRGRDTLVWQPARCLRQDYLFHKSMAKPPSIYLTQEQKDEIEAEALDGLSLADLAGLADEHGMDLEALLALLNRRKE